MPIQVGSTLLYSGGHRTNTYWMAKSRYHQLHALGLCGVSTVASVVATHCENFAFRHAKRRQRKSKRKPASRRQLRSTEKGSTPRHRSQYPLWVRSEHVQCNSLFISLSYAVESAHGFRDT